MRGRPGRLHGCREPRRGRLLSCLGRRQVAAPQLDRQALGHLGRLRSRHGQVGAARFAGPSSPLADAVHGDHDLVVQAGQARVDAPEGELVHQHLQHGWTEREGWGGVKWGGGPVVAMAACVKLHVRGCVCASCINGAPGRRAGAPPVPARASAPGPCTRCAQSRRAPARGPRAPWRRPCARASPAA